MVSVSAVLKYAAEEVRENADNPNWWRNRINDRVNGPVHRRFASHGIDVMDADWDNLVIVDGCRSDLFEEVVDTSDFDSYSRQRSRGSSTAQWSRRNFTGNYADTVYVSGNPVPSRHIVGEFFKFEEVWREAFDESIGTIRAEDVVERALELFEEYPNKRFIIHLMQPHYPFVRDQDINFSYWQQTDEIQFGGDDRAKDVWDALSRGLISRDRVWNAYCRNLEYAMENVEELLLQLEGRTVVTSDHGNAIGERNWPIPVKVFGHSGQIHIDSLVEVPWAVDNGPRRRIVAGDTIQHVDVDEADAEDQLEALGYV